MTNRAGRDQQPDAWRPFNKTSRNPRPSAQSRRPRPSLLDRIAPLSADLAAHGRTRALALKKLRRICQAEVRRLKASIRPPSNFTSPNIGTRSAKSTLTTWSCAPERYAPASVSPTPLSIQKKPALSMRLTTSASTRTNPTSSLWIRRPSSKQRLTLLASDRYLEKAWP